MQRPRNTQIVISTADLTARNGDKQMVFRCSSDDKKDLDDAAEKLKMSTAQFVRMIVIQAARKVLSEAA